MKEKFKDKPNVHYVALGMSMGANYMMKAAGILGKDFPFEGMISFNNPFNLWKAIELMRGSIYEKYLIKSVSRNIVYRKNQTEQEKEILKKMEKAYGISPEKITSTLTWKDYDKHFTSKVFCNNGETKQYYLDASSYNHIKDITVPTLVIHSKDDPVISIKCLPLDECVDNKNIIVGIVKKGGHVCYF